MEALQLQEEIRSSWPIGFPSLLKHVHRRDLPWQNVYNLYDSDAYKPPERSCKLKHCVKPSRWCIKSPVNAHGNPSRWRVGVSSTPIREAIRKLELEGFVVMVPRRGTPVANISLKDITQSIWNSIGPRRISRRSCSRTHHRRRNWNFRKNACRNRRPMESKKIWTLL